MIYTLYIVHLIFNLKLYYNFCTGQTIDAMSTPFVGVVVDKFGKKKNWILLGKYLYLLYITRIHIAVKPTEFDTKQPIHACVRRRLI